MVPLPKWAFEGLPSWPAETDDVIQGRTVCEPTRGIGTPVRAAPRECVEMGS